MINAARALANEKTTPFGILLAMYDEMGYEWVNWEPETIWDEIREKLDVDPPRTNKDKIMALKLCIKTTVPWEDWHPFTATVLAFNDVPVDMEMGQECSPAHLAYGVKVLTSLQPGHEYKRDVQFTAAAMLIANGICWVPQEPLASLVNEALAYLVEQASGDTSIIDIAKQNYANYLEGADLGEDDIHATRLAAIDEYLKYKEALAEREAV